MQGFQRPPVFNQTKSKKIEQFRVTRRRGAEAKIARRVDQPGSEMVLPDAIDDDPCGEWVVATGDALREFKPPGAIFKIGGSKDRQRPSRDLIALGRVVAAQKDVRVLRDRRVLHRHRVRSQLAQLDDTAFDIGEECLQPSLRRLIEEPLDIVQVAARDGTRRTGAVQHLRDHRVRGVVFEKFSVAASDVFHPAWGGLGKRGRD